MKRLLSLVLAGVLVLLVVNILSEGVVPDGAAVATRVEGTVNVFTSESPAGRLIRINDTVAKTDRVEVLGGSRLELRLPDGGYLRLWENSRFTLRMLKFEKKTRTLYLQALLDHGKLWVKINKRAKPESSVEVITGPAIVVSKAAVYALDAEEEAGAAISVYEGTVQTVSSGKEATRTAGQTSAPADVQPLSAQALQQVSVSARDRLPQTRVFDPKALINDWTRWNLQRDAREELASITVIPAAATVTRGSSLQFSGVAHYPDKTEKDITWFATWSSSDAGIAKIDSLGRAAGAAIGAATISAAIEDMNGSTVLNVSRDILSIKVTPASRSVVNGAVQQFTATATFSDRTIKDITSSVVWRSSNADIAFVDAAGRAVAGKTAGTAVISASLGTRRGSATLKVRRELVSLTILPESAMVMGYETQRFGAIGHYSDGSTQDLTEKVEWETSDAAIAEIDQAQEGRVIGKNTAGSAAISASIDGKTASATITISAISSP